MEVPIETPPEGTTTGTTSTTVPASIINEDHMPDVNDPDAGFCPTIDQPYRRSRRHTVT
jgi:hypothetical protein